MPRLAANLTLLYNEVPFLERFALAARDGFTAVECQFPYAWDARDIRQCLDASGLQLVLHNLPAGDWAAGDRGIACHPDRVDEFREAVSLALDYARVLGAGQLNCLAGIAPAGPSDEELHHTLVENLRHAAARLGAEGLKLLVEPINTFDMPGFYLHGSAQTLALLDAVGAGNAWLQYDIYHMQRMEGELAATLHRHLPRIAHIQLADNPGRHEPGTGEINYAFLLRFLDRIGYQGWVGCEYLPLGATRDGLGWLQALRRPDRPGDLHP